MGKHVYTQPVTVKIARAFWRNTLDKDTFSKITLNTKGQQSIHEMLLNPRQDLTLYIGVHVVWVYHVALLKTKEALFHADFIGNFFVGDHCIALLWLMIMESTRRAFHGSVESFRRVINQALIGTWPDNFGK